MKKSLKSRIAGIASVLAFSLFLFSCASAPKAEEPVVQTEETLETEDEPAEEKETPAEEIPETENQVAEEPKAEEITEEPVFEPIPELIEDIPGYYESDPKPVFLEPSEPVAKTEEKAAEEEPAVEPEKQTSETEEKNDSNTEISLKDTENEKPQAPMETEKEVVPVAVPEKKEEPSPAPEESIEAEGIAAVEEVESSELLSVDNEPEEEKKTVENKIIVVPSRSVEMKNSQYLDIVYPGTGWIYLGEEDGKTSMRYFGRKIGERNTVFSLRSREEGNTILHFYKNDQLTGKFIDDYLQVEIKGTNNSPEHAVAPAYAEAVPPKPEKKVLTQPKVTERQDEEVQKENTVGSQKHSVSSEKKSARSSAPKTDAKKVSTPVPVASPAPVVSDSADDNGSKTVIQKKTSENEYKPAPKSENSTDAESAPQEKTTPSVSKSSIQNTENMAADEILEKARESFKNKKYEETLAYLDDFFAKATTKIDEGLMLQGQTFESNSSVRNIKSALDTYETIVRRYPQSIHWPKANERITYLRKFYFNIR